MRCLRLGAVGRTRAAVFGVTLRDGPTDLWARPSPLVYSACKNSETNSVTAGITDSKPQSRNVCNAAVIFTDPKTPQRAQRTHDCSDMTSVRSGEIKQKIIKTGEILYQSVKSEGDEASV
ncbi:hypothetical protein BaRGS_00018203 [Batillaria attramentaria]|uniref:Uncharacterized protein n=1 Tax=Batillaria attramentaria TaxID=370345 RepID=A0ABD0KUX0_9CAEN